MSELLKNIHKIHTTKLGEERIQKNLGISDVVSTVKEYVLNPDCLITKKGKNYYCDVDQVLITINASNYCIITAHRKVFPRRRQMYLKEYLKTFGNQKIKLFVDMDGVIADYIFDNARDYDKKRPLYDSIQKLEAVSRMTNVEMFIFSATRKNEGIEQKHWWLDTYAPFFKKKNRIILSREANDMIESSVLKANYLKSYKRDKSILIVIDDDPKNLRDIRKENEDVILLKDTVLVD